MITYHPTATNPEARAELDAAFEKWLSADCVAENYSYEDAAANEGATVALMEYQAVKIYRTYDRVLVVAQQTRVVA